MTYTEIFEADTAIVKPELVSVCELSIKEVVKTLNPHHTLSELWEEIGCGSFLSGKDGNLLVDKINLLLMPEEVLELHEIAHMLDENTFDVGIPFFETSDMYHMVVTATGEIRYCTGTYVAADMMEFFQELMMDPIFYVERLVG